MKVAAAAILTALALTSVAAAQESGVSERLSIARAIELAVAGNRQLRTAALERDKADERLAAARTERLPRFSVNLRAAQLVTPIDFLFAQGVFGTYPDIGPVPDRDRAITTPRHPTAFVNANVGQPLTQLRRIGLGVRLSDLAREAAAVEIDGTRQAVVSEVKRLYFAMVRTQSARRASEHAVALYRELDRVVGQHVLQRVSLRSELLDVGTALAREELKTLSLRNTIESQQEQMNLLLGRDVRVRFETDPVPPLSEYERDLAAAQAQAVRRRPDLRSAQLRLEQATLDREAKRLEGVPDVTLTFSYISFVNVAMLPANVASLGVTASWEPWDWGRRRRELNERALTIEQARAGIDESEARILLDVAARHRALGEARASVRVSEAARESAEEKLRVGTTRLAADAALMTDVLRQRADLAQAVDGWEQATLAFWSARADFEQSIGMEQP